MSTRSSAPVSRSDWPTSPRACRTTSSPGTPSRWDPKSCTVPSLKPRAIRVTSSTPTEGGCSVDLRLSGSPPERTTAGRRGRRCAGRPRKPAEWRLSALRPTGTLPRTAGARCGGVPAAAVLSCRLLHALSGPERLVSPRALDARLRPLTVPPPGVRVASSRTRCFPHHPPRTQRDRPLCARPVLTRFHTARMQLCERWSRRFGPEGAATGPTAPRRHLARQPCLGLRPGSAAMSRLRRRARRPFGLSPVDPGQVRAVTVPLPPRPPAAPGPPSCSLRPTSYCVLAPGLLPGGAVDLGPLDSYRAAGVRYLRRSVGGRAAADQGTKGRPRCAVRGRAAFPDRG